MYPFVLFNFAYRNIYNDIVNFIPKLRRCLPENYSSDYHIKIIDDNSILVYYKSTKYDFSLINPGYITSYDNSSSIFCSGYAWENMLTNNHIFALLDYKNNCLRDSPGGIGCYIWKKKNSNELICWTTQPPAHNLYVSSYRDGLCVVGNMPLLVHYSAQLAIIKTFDNDYFEKYITCGFGFDSSTPYAKVQACPPWTSLRIQNGKFKFYDYVLSTPPAIPQETPLSDKSAILVELLKKACYCLNKYNSSYILLSGGKDSRLLAATLGQYSLYSQKNIKAITYGREGWGETDIARRVAETIGFPLEIRKMRFIGDVRRALANSNFQTQGLGIAFTHQCQFDQDIALWGDGPAFHGNGHLLRGGSARTMDINRDRIADLVRKTFYTDFTTDNTFVDNFIRRWIDKRSTVFKDPRDVLFYVHQDFRIGQFTAPITLEMTSKALMNYPYIDERIARFASQLCVYDRVSERVAFGAIKQMSDKLSRIPLFGENWRFDRNLPYTTKHKDSDHNFEDGYEERQAAQNSKIVKRTKNHWDSFIHCFDFTERNFNQDFVKIIVQSSFYNRIEKMVDKKVIEYIKYIENNNLNEHFSLENNGLESSLNNFMRRLAVACSIFELHW